MDAAREYTDREIRRVARELAMEYGRLGDEQAGRVMDFLTERAVDGVVPESALQGREWRELRESVASWMNIRNTESSTDVNLMMEGIRDVASGGEWSMWRVPRTTVNRAKDITWNERHVEAAARAAVGKDPKVAADGVRRLADMNRGAALRRARTAINGAENAGRMDAMTDKGGYKRWVAVMDERTRVSHASINGEVVEVEEPFSNGLMYPGDPSGPPEEVYNCRCKVEWVKELTQHVPDGEQKKDETSGYSVTRETLPMPSGTEGERLPDRECDVYTTPDGHRFIFPTGMDPSAQPMDPDRAISLFNRVPAEVRALAQEDVYFVDYENPQDEHWRTVYPNFTRSYATGGKEITFYSYPRHNDDYVVRTYEHEAGHWIDRMSGELSRGNETSYGDEWKTAMEEDAKVNGGRRSPTPYGESSVIEDFAESVAAYCDPSSGFADNFPNRYRLIRGILTSRRKR